MKELKSSTGKLITKSTAIFVKDSDGHDYCIHEEDEDLFYELCAEDDATEDLTEFPVHFSSIGMDPNYFRKHYLNPSGHEEIQRAEKMEIAINSILSLKDLWLYGENINPEHEGEAIALNNTYRLLQQSISTFKTENNAKHLD